MRTGYSILFEHCHINFSQASNVRLSPSETLKSSWIIFELLRCGITGCGLACVGLWPINHGLMANQTHHEWLAIKNFIHGTTFMRGIVRASI